MRNLYGFINAREKVARGVFLFSAIFSILALATITVFLFISGVPFIAKTGFAKFLFGSDWAPLADNPSYGIFPMIVASLYVTALSVIIGIGIGLLTAISLYKFCPKKLVAPIRQMINLLAGIPSVIFGLFGMISEAFNPSKADNCTYYEVAKAGIAVIVNKANTFDNISLEDLKNIYNVEAGDAAIKTWAGVSK